MAKERALTETITYRTKQAVACFTTILLAGSGWLNFMWNDVSTSYWYMVVPGGIAIFGFFMVCWVLDRRIMRLIAELEELR